MMLVLWKPPTVHCGRLPVTLYAVWPLLHMNELANLREGVLIAYELLVFKIWVLLHFRNAILESLIFHHYS